MEGMFNLANSSLDSCTGVLSASFSVLHFPTPLSNWDLRRTKSQTKSSSFFTRMCRATPFMMEWTGLANLRIKIGLEALLAFAHQHRHSLSLWASNLITVTILK